MSNWVILIPSSFACKEDFIAWSDAILLDVMHWPANTELLSQGLLSIPEAICKTRNALVNLKSVINEKLTVELPWQVDVKKGEAVLETLIIDFCLFDNHECGFSPIGARHKYPAKTLPQDHLALQLKDVDGVLFKTAMQAIYKAINEKVDDEI